MPDGWKITNALLAKLQADAALLALMPDGIWHQEAPPGSTRFVIVSAIHVENVPTFGGLAFKDGLWMVEARALSTTTGNVHAASTRLGELLEDGTLTVAGYGLMTMHCEEDIEDVEIDEMDASIRWNRCGGNYRVQVARN